MRFPIRSVITFSLLVAFAASGCYTKLMTPNEFVHTQRSQPKIVLADNSYSINYHQSCVTCHSSTELNERAEELEYYGVQTVHDGILLSSRDWLNGSVDGPILLPSPYWPNPYNPVSPWWAPPVTSVTVAAPGTGNGNRIRTDGTSRDGNRDGDRSAPISSPTYSQPQTSSGSSTPAPSTPAPAVRVAPSTTPAPTNEAARSRETNESTNSTNRTRSDGSSRDDSGDRPR